MNVQDSGGLPDYVCRIAKALKRTGKTTSQAIAIAVSRVKKWATGAGVDKDTQAKAAAAVAEWEKLRAKSHAKSGAKKSAHALAASAGPDNILILSSSVSFNVDSVRGAFRAKYPYSMDSTPTPYIKEMWSDHLIVSKGWDEDQKLQRIDYSVDEEGGVTFENPLDVRVEYVVIKSNDMVGATLSDAELHCLIALTPPCNSTATDKVLLSITQKPGALDSLLSVAREGRG